MVEMTPGTASCMLFLNLMAAGEGTFFSSCACCQCGDAVACNWNAVFLAWAQEALAGAGVGWVWSITYGCDMKAHAEACERFRQS